MTNAEMFAGSMASLFAKRFMDPQYDRLLDYEPMERIRKYRRGGRLTIETLLYAIGSYVDVFMQDTSAPRKIVKELLVDGTSEIGSRLQNTPVPRESPIWRLVELSEDRLDEFLTWYWSLDERHRSEVRGLITRKSAEHIHKMMDLRPENRRRLVELSIDHKPLIPRRIPFLDALTARLKPRRIPW